MATEIIPFASTNELPAHLASMFGDEESNILPKATINQLSFKGKTWTRIVNGEATELTRKDPETGDVLPMQIVNLVVLSLNKNRSRAYYEGAFEDGKNQAPRCTSADGVKPDANVKDPCAATCASCPNSVKGSKVTENQKLTTACSPFKRLAVVPSGVNGITNHPPMLLRLAQTSVWDKDNAANEAQGWYAWDQYLDMLRSRGAKHTAAVETKVKFDSSKAFPKLLFCASRWLNADEAAAAKAVMADKAEELAKIIDGGGANDGVAGSPGIPSEGVPAQQADDGAAAAEAAAKAAADAEAKKKADEAAAKKAAAAKKKADEAAAAKAAADAAEAAAAAAAKVVTEEDDGFGGFGEVAPAATAQTTAPAASAAAGNVEVVDAGQTPAALTDLLNGWDD